MSYFGNNKFCLSWHFLILACLHNCKPMKPGNSNRLFIVDFSFPENKIMALERYKVYFYMII